MALVKITEESLREQAGDRVFEQALAIADKVAGLSADGPLIEAAVDGIPVSVRIGPHGIDARCGCPAPGPCLHAVAVALAWVRTGEDEQVTDLLETLRALDRDWLARQLAELAAGDPVLSARLLEAADADAVGAAAAVADLRAEFAEELGGLAEEARNHEHYDEWYPDTGDLEELLDEAEVFLDQAPDAVRELADSVVGVEPTWRTLPPLCAPVSWWGTRSLVRLLRLAVPLPRAGGRFGWRRGCRGAGRGAYGHCRLGLLTPSKRARPSAYWAGRLLKALQAEGLEQGRPFAG